MGGPDRPLSGMFAERAPREVPASGRRTIPSWWRAIADTHMQRDAIREHGRSVTYEDLDRRSERLGRGLLSLGLGKGSRVALLFPNGSDWVAGWLAVSRIGGIAVCLSTFFSPRELALALRQADVAVLLTADRYLRHDYPERLEASLSGLGAADGQADLALLEAPYLRSIWIGGDVCPAWSRGTLGDLEAAGAAASSNRPALLGAVEALGSPADLAIMIFTSGTTAEPKAIVHTQGALIDKFLYLTEIDTIMPFDLSAGDRPLVTSPLFWVGGLLTVGGALTIGATIVCEDEHTPEALVARMRSERVTHVSGWGASVRVLFDVGDRSEELQSIKPLAITQLPYVRGAEEHSPDSFPNSLGMTETIGPHSGLPAGGLLSEGKRRSFGHALPGVELKIVDPVTRKRRDPGAAGELLVRGRWLMDGFYKRERSESFDADGFYATGDSCSLDADGHLYFHGRLGGMIKTTGANVSPEEVEASIRGHPDVLESAVFGVPHPGMGEMVAAVVAKRPDSDLTERELQDFLRSQLSSFKVPKRILFMAQDDLPKTPSQKIRTAAIAQRLAEEMDTANSRPEPPQRS